MCALKDQKSALSCSRRSILKELKQGAKLFQQLTEYFYKKKIKKIPDVITSPLLPPFIQYYYNPR